MLQPRKHRPWLPAQLGVTTTEKKSEMQRGNVASTRQGTRNFEDVLVLQIKQYKLGVLVDSREGTWKSLRRLSATISSR